MPFKSEAQRKYLYANEPAVAKKFQKHTPKGKKLPKKAKEKNAMFKLASGIHIEKASGYFQNIVGFNNLKKFTKLRDNIREAEDPWEAADTLTTEALGGTDFGYTGKYNEIPKLVARYREASMSGEPTGEGYLTKEEVLKHPYLAKSNLALYNDEQLNTLLDRIRKSKHKYFTSTEIS